MISHLLPLCSTESSLRENWIQNSFVRFTKKYEEQFYAKNAFSKYFCEKFGNSNVGLDLLVKFDVLDWKSKVVDFRTGFD